MPQRSRRRSGDDTPTPPSRPVVGSEEPDGTGWTSYWDADTCRGPAPAPAWVITTADATDDDLGVLKSGKEADVSLLRRSANGCDSLLAVKRYRDAQHRMFHRDRGYLEGRRTRITRDTRAMANRTAYGKAIIAGQWAHAEFAVLARLWSAGVAVPYPVQLSGTELMMEFIGTPEGVAAPRLAELRPDRAAAGELFSQMVEVLVHLADAGYAHGDLSPYNVLVDDRRLVMIDLPQAVDIVGNPQGFAFLRRDCENICSWFATRGVAADADDLEADLRRSLPGAS